MRKIIVVFLLCTTVPLFAEHVDPETARKVATTFLSNNGAKAARLTDLSKAAGFPNLYIFNAEEGFVVMSADDCVRPILGYSLTGHFEVSNMPENVSSWLQGYSDEIQFAIENGARAAAETSILWKDLAAGKGDVARTTVVVAPLIQTKWNQNRYYNDLCPVVSDGPNGRAYTGCVATAMAQVMNYWQHPATGTGSYSYTWNEQTLSANFGETTYDWADMAQYYEYYYDDGGAYHTVQTTSAQNTAVATLMFHCGVSIDMNYGGYSTGGSGTATSNVADALKNYFGYSPTVCFKEKSSYADAQWKTMVKGELDADRPLEYCGSDPNGPSGHAFVCDGYNDADYFHFNWGWSGAYDGYFSLDNLNTGANNQSGQGNGTYTRAQGAVFGIEPASQLTAPTLAASTGHGVATLTWNAVEGATSYSVFKDNQKIPGNITSTTFSDENIAFGMNYEYYVRANNGEHSSNPSNTVIVNSKYRIITPSNLTVSYDEDAASLNWTGYDGGASTDLHYGLEYGGYIYGTNSGETYWGQKFPSPTLEFLQGMMIEKVSSFLYYSGEYSLSIFSGDVNNSPISNVSYTKANTSFEWVDFILPQPIALNTSNDLWVTFYCSSPGKYPVTVAFFDGEGAEYASYLAESLATLPNNCVSDISWLIRTYITDGIFTYNLYDGNNKVNGDVPINGTSYSISGPIGNGIHHYTVKTAYANGESEASNKASLAVGSSPSLENLTIGDNDQMTLTSGSTLTVSGTISNNDAANLVIEDGAQLIHPNSDMAATLKKTIQPYSEGDNDGWYTIASPVSNANVGLATNGDYDLYAYDEKNMLWLNQENAANNITQFTEGQGFLYANAANQSLSFAGSMKATNEQISVPMSYQSGNESLKGFNLVGNPFTRNLNAGDIQLGGIALTTYYVVENGSELEARAISTYPVKPGQGFLVQASAEGQNLVFNPSAKDGSAKPSFISIETDGQGCTERAYVHVGEGNMLRKMTLRDASTQLGIVHNDGEYAAITLESPTGEVPLRFHANENGLHTLTFGIENIDSDYVHLIDHLTGADIDLLTTPSYTFEAKTSDYPMRFQLVFSETGNSNGINDGLMEGTTQILDMTGRVVATDRNTRLAPGVYILRTVNEKETSSQKIIIK